MDAVALLHHARHHQRRLRRGARRALARPHRAIVVPLLGSAEAEHALVLACRLAAERGSRVLLVAPLFVEAALPLDAHFLAEERDLHRELERMRALAETYGVGVRGRVVRTRHGQLGNAVADVADEQSATLIVVGEPAQSQTGFRDPFSRDTWSILREAPCRVMIATGAAAHAA